MFHSVRAQDTGVATWQAWRDYMLANPSLKAVSQNSPTGVGIPDTQWAQRVSVDWDYIGSANDAAAADALAARVNAITPLRPVVIDEVRGGGSGYDPVPMISLAIPQFDSPTSVYLYLAPGKNISYDQLDASDEFPVITQALTYGCGLLPEMYIPQPQAEASGNVGQFIERWYRGPGDGKMPYLLELKSVLGSSSPIHFIYPVIDRFFKGQRRQKLTHAQFLDLVIQRAARSYPEVFAAGFGTWIWDSTRLKDTGRGAQVAALHAFYYSAAYALTPGGRYFTASR